MPDNRPSALLGDPPLTARDALIQKAMRQYRTLFSANPKHPFGPSRPVPPAPDLAHESNAWRVLTAASCLLFLLIVVTAGRFWFRWQRRRQMGFGVDDVLIVPAVALAITYVVQIIEEVTESCLGRHMWFCTYEDIELLYHVSIEIFVFRIARMVMQVVCLKCPIPRLLALLFPCYHLE